MQIIAFPFEEWMLLHVQDNIKVPGWASLRSALADSRKANATTVFDSGGNLGVHRSLTQQAALSLAFRARVRNDGAIALAGRAGAGDAEKSLLIPDLTAAAAGATRHRRFSRRSAGARTLLTVFMAPHIYLRLGAEYCFLKFQGDVFSEVRAPLRAIAAARVSAPEHVANAKEISEDVAQILEA
jgi:hypothetical protein